MIEKRSSCFLSIKSSGNYNHKNQRNTSEKVSKKIYLNE